MCLADFISRDGDWIGGFAVSIHGIEPHLARFKAAIDDYSDILLKALADRFAEAMAEAMHRHVRTTLWGYAPDEQLTNEALIKEQYRGIRPAPGYPACPDHSREADPVQAARCASRDRHLADGELCDAADRGGLRLLFRPSPRRSISAWPVSAAISWRNMPSDAGWTCRRRNAGFGQSRLTLVPPRARSVRETIRFFSEWWRG